MSFHCTAHGKIEQQFLKWRTTKKQRTKDPTKEVWVMQRICPNCECDVYPLEDDQET